MRYALGQKAIDKKVAGYLSHPLIVPLNKQRPLPFGLSLPVLSLSKGRSLS